MRAVGPSTPTPLERAFFVMVTVAVAATIVLMSLYIGGFVDFARDALTGLP